MTIVRGRIATAVAGGWALPVLLLVLGAAARLAWVALFAPHGFADGEIANVAIAYAKTGVLADAYNAGEGPTAHVLPIPPFVAGMIYRAFGIRSVVSETVLLTLVTTTVLASYALLFRIFGMLGTPRWARLLALAAACLLPLNFRLETVEFRIWEGALGVALALGFLLALLKLERTAEIRLPAIAAMSVAAAVVLFVSPALGAAAYVCSLLMLVDRLPVRRWPVAIVVACVGLAVIVVPWSVRNRAVLGEAVLLRSDFGMEIAMANHPAAAAAATPAEDRLAFQARADEIHPYHRALGAAAMQSAGGEVAYSRALGTTTKAWIAGHPVDFARLSLKHLSQYFFPPQWQWHAYLNGGKARGHANGAKLAVHWLIAAAGLAGALAALLRAGRRYRYAALMFLLPALPYMIVQPVLRYRYIMFGLSIYFAADLLAYLVVRWRSGSRSWSRAAVVPLAGAPS